MIFSDLTPVRTLAYIPDPLLQVSMKFNKYINTSFYLLLNFEIPSEKMNPHGNVQN